MIEQSVIDEEAGILCETAWLIGMGELQLGVSNRDEGALIIPLTLDGVPVTWNDLPPGVEERETTLEGTKVNLRVRCAAPMLITLILPDGEIVRGLDGDHELWDALTIAIEMHYMAAITDQYNRWVQEQLGHMTGFSIN